ncbi:hypothetical protein CC85DRAFT_306502 [Cutaneotrichosporon oleaginosum]|uniref:Multiple RNA-binding domain-containing protein 1 n=1 Tax=Cutaneotrichosporon oleaginosum TaxID=879819 RepID=A0A0J1BC65_9TREE|nr:uncharacterized protein CC85DRAFT_306502 [Cutaneotrichosporon oleaginosum]KLT45609.1 hypothetical protein CC85DRAFT_306502 [Cutaneotrichosporon oleaginosum]TXT04594.1 hypothetical protein COLE_07413 [Cutaneotrichosporon oleaginosum]
MSRTPGIFRSRLIFLNLPPGLTPESFRAKLTEPKTLKDATVTDSKLVPKRRFAFVGYATEEDAKAAKKWFDGSFAFGGGKVKVDFVRDEPLAPKPEKPAKRARLDNDAEAVPEKNEKREKKGLKEFMEVMKGVDPTKPHEAPPGGAGVADSKRKKAEPAAEEDEEQEAVDDDEDDAAWLAKRQQRLDEDEMPTEPQLDPEDALIMSTGRLFVRNLAFVTTADDLREEFGRYGAVVDVHLPVSQKTGEPLGTAFILFREPADALRARQKLDKMTFKGRLLHVLPGRARPGQETVVEVGKSTTDGKVLGKAAEARGEVKARQDEKRVQASAKGLNWATLYMNSDAVAASVADRMGVSKADLLSGSDDISPAVKLALAETHVIAETKTYFEKEGIVLDSLQPRVPRSKTVILVKNIPYGTSITALQDLFAPHGELKRVLLPPAGTIGVVEFENAMDAGRAFRALAYRRLGNAVLYLEKGPEGMFKDPTAKNTPASKEAAERAALVEKVAAAAEELRDQPAPEDEAGSTLFLKNLAWATTTTRLSSVLSTLPGFSFARVQTKPDPKRPGERLSMGYGFVGFKTKKEAQQALAGLQGFEVDGHTLEAKFAQRGVEDDKDEKDKKAEMGGTKSTKLLVKNLPFEAGKKDVRALFSAYGTLKSLRVPKKSTLSATGAASSRGFAFLEFTTHAEAQRAMDALKHTHLLGRHLVCEWAKEGDSVDVDALREKVSRDARGGVGGKRKFDHGGKGEEDDGLEV